MSRPRIAENAPGPGPLARIPGDIKAKAEWVYGSSDQKACIKALLADGSMAMLLYRCMQSCSKHKIAPLEMLFNKLCIVLGGCIIGRGADFGERFVLIHSTGIVINGSVVGGDDIKLEHQVTIGAERGESPTLGSDIFVGAGAKIVGSVHIADGAKIGANAVVTKSISKGATAVGIPARELPPQTVSADPSGDGKTPNA